MRRLGVVLVAAVLVWPSAARGDAPLPWQQKALSVAQRVWHPTCGQLTLSYGPPADSGAFDSTTGTIVRDAAGWTVLGDCSLHASDDRDWRHLGYPVLCTVVLHEAGHAANMPDIPGPGIMKGNLLPSRGRGTVNGRRVTLWSDVDGRCVRPMDRTWAPTSSTAA